MRIFLFFIFISPWLTQAQEGTKALFSGGFQAGFTSSQIHGDGYSGFDKGGWTAGFLLRASKKESSSWQMELNYVTKGSFDPPNFNVGKIFWTKIQLDYVEIPFQYNYHPKKWIFSLGLAPGILIRQKQETTLFVGDVIRAIKPYELSTIFGISYRLSESWNVHWRNSISLIPISGNAIARPPFWGVYGGAYNQYMSFTLSYFFK